MFGLNCPSKGWDRCMEFNHKDKDNNELHTPRVKKQILNNSTQHNGTLNLNMVTEKFTCWEISVKKWAGLKLNDVSHSN